MTLVYKQDRTGPKTHALVIGCGRFSMFPSGEIDRPATVAGARGIIAFLRDHAEDLVAPLGSIEVLLSDPAAKPGLDSLARGAADPRTDELVGAASYDKARLAGRDWLGRFEAGDHLLFYMSSHGVVDNALSAIAILEDFRSNPDAPFSDAIDVSQLGRGLSSKPAGAYWVFLDACQEITDLVNQPDGSGALMLLTPQIQKLANPNGTPCLCLAGSRFGGRAWAPNGNAPPFFTQALLDAMTRSGVTKVPKLGWVVTGQRLIYDLAKVADAALGILGLETEPLRSTARDPALVKLASPDIPVVVRTEVEAHLQGLELAALDAAGNRIAFKQKGSAEWRFRVPADGSRYRIEPAAGGSPQYGGEVFDADPAAQIISLTQSAAPPFFSPPPATARFRPLDEIARMKDVSIIALETAAFPHSDIELVAADIVRDGAPGFAIGLSMAKPGQVGAHGWSADRLPLTVKSTGTGLLIRFDRPPDWAERPLWRLTLSVSGKSAVRVQLPLFARGTIVMVEPVATPNGQEFALYAAPYETELTMLLEGIERLGPDEMQAAVARLAGATGDDAPPSAETADPWSLALAALLVARGGADAGPARQAIQLTDRYPWLPDGFVAAAWRAAAAAEADSAELDATCLELLKRGRRPYFRLASRMGLELLATLEVSARDEATRRHARTEANTWRRHARQSRGRGPIATWRLDGRALDEGRLDETFATIAKGRVTAAGLRLDRPEASEDAQDDGVAGDPVQSGD